MLPRGRPSLPLPRAADESLASPELAEATLAAAPGIGHLFHHAAMRHPGDD
jgi:hypothetical protein